MDETDRGKVVRFFLAGSVLCLVGMFFSFYLKGFILYGSQFGRKYKIIGATYMTLNNQKNSIAFSTSHVRISSV